MACRGVSRGLCGVAFIKSLSSKVLAVMVGAAVMIQAQGPALANAVEEKPLYISEVYLSYSLDEMTDLELLNQIAIYRRYDLEIPFATPEYDTPSMSYDDWVDAMNDFDDSEGITGLISECEDLREPVLEDNLRKKNIETVETLLSRSKGWKIAGAVLCIAGLLIAIGAAVVTVYDYYKYYHQEYKPIPDKLVHESKDDRGRAAYTVYNVTFCNRSEQGFGKESLGSNGDMNGDVGKQWLALYTTTDKSAGEPITADIVAQKGSNRMPTDKGTGIRLFGQNDMLNIVSTVYGYEDKLNGLYIFAGTKSVNNAPKASPEQPADDSSSKSDASSDAEPASATESTEDTSAAAATSDADSSGTDKANAAGSVVGTGVMVGSCVGSAALGALVCFLIVRSKRRDMAA